MEKAYKLLANAKNISHKHAKNLIDRGLVLANGQKISLARTLLSAKSTFVIQNVQAPNILLHDENLLAIDKPAFVESYELLSWVLSHTNIKDFVLLHRLDKDTSGVLLFVREGSEFAKKARLEFKNRRVYKEYRALVSGIIAESRTINKPISTKKGKSAKSKIDKNGLEAISHIEPLGIIGKKTLLKVVIETGRTHQIRIHLHSISHPIIGDSLYDGINAPRLMLHAYKISLLGYDIIANPPKELEL